MREVEVKLHHSSPYPTYRPGDTVRGEVILHLSKQTKVKKIEVEFGWHTTGRGDTDRDSIDIQVLPGQTYEAGTYNVPFEFTMPMEGPPSYEGELIHLHWHVEARVDIPWAKDPSALASFRFDQNHAWTDTRFATELTQEHHDDDKGGCLLLGALIAGLFALIMVYMSIEEEEVEFICCTIISIGAAGFMGYVGGHRFLATRLVKNAKLHADSWPAVIGDTFRYHLEFDAGSKMEVTEVNMTLTCTENATYTRGTDTVTDTFTVFEEEITLTPTNRQIAKGEHVVYTGEWHLHGDFPPTLTIDNNNITWEVETCIDIPNWPDWEQEVEILVDRQRDDDPPQQMQGPVEPESMF